MLEGVHGILWRRYHFDNVTLHNKSWVIEKWGLSTRLNEELEPSGFNFEVFDKYWGARPRAGAHRMWEGDAVNKSENASFIKEYQMNNVNDAAREDVLRSCVLHDDLWLAAHL